MRATLIGLSAALTWAVLGSSVAHAGGQPRRETAFLARAPLAISVKNGRLTANVTEAPLGRVIEEIARQSGLRIVLHEAGDVPVTLRLVNRRLDEALTLIVGSHNLVFVYSGLGCVKFTSTGRRA